jgi:septal ring factor EnvC (AmiA/AmiB activator)
MAVSVLDAVSTGEYRDERLYLLKTIERLEEDSKQQRETIGRIRELVDKFKTDLNDAHKKMKGLQTSSDGFTRRLTRSEIRAGCIAASTGTVLAILFEIGKALISHR